MPKSEIGWAIWPDAFRDELIGLSNTYKLPIYVTENGWGGRLAAPDAKGQKRTPKNSYAWVRDFVAAAR